MLCRVIQYKMFFDHIYRPKKSQGLMNLFVFFDYFETVFVLFERVDVACNLGGKRLFVRDFQQ